MADPAYMLTPAPGSLNVSPTSEVVVCFEGCSNEDKRAVNIRVGGMWAVCDGNVQDGFETTRCSHKDDTLIWGVKRIRGLPPRTILVQAWCGSGSYTVDQRFFVRSAKAISPHLMGPGVPEDTFEGAFHIGKGVWKTPNAHVRSDKWRGRGKPVYKDGTYIGVYPGSIGVLKGESIEYHTIPKFVLSGAHKWDAGKDGLVVSCLPNEVVFSLRGDVHCWDIRAKGVQVCNGWVHLDMGRITAHIPASYWPAKSERGLDSWYIMENIGDGHNLFHRDLFVWWDQDRLVAKHSPDPILNSSNDMLWRSSDIDQAFDSVKILDSTHILANKNLHLNTLYPEITRT